MVITGYSKYLPKSGEAYAVKVHQMATDQFHDCSSTGAADKINTASDLELLYPNEEGFSWYEATSETMTFFGKDDILGKSLVLFAHESYEANSDEDSESSKMAQEPGKKPDSASRVREAAKPIACCTITPTNYFK